MTERLDSKSVRVLLRSIAVFASITLAGAYLAFFLAGQAQAQTPDVEFAWSKQFGTSANDSPRSVAVGADGNVYAAGYTEGSLAGVSAGGRDTFVSKHLAADGGPGWSRQLGSASSDEAFDVAADRQGNAYVVGRGDVVNRGTSGGFVVKYDAQGNTNFASTSGSVWAKQIVEGTVRTVAVDPDNNVFISLNINSDVYVYKFAPDDALLASQPFGAYGCFGTSLLDFAFGSAVGTRSDDPSVYITGITAGQKLDAPNNCNISTSEDSMFLIKFDGAMNKRWDRQFGGTGGDSTPIDLAVDSENNAYVTGFTPSGGQVRDPSALTGGLQNAFGGRDAFIFKYGGDGTPFYAKQFGTSSDDLARGIVAGPGQVLELTGRTTGSFDPAKPNAGLGDVFMSRRRAGDGGEVVTRQFGSAGDDSALGLGYDQATDNLVVAGLTDGALFGQNAGGQDAFVAKVGYAPNADPSDNLGSNSTGDAGSNPSDVGDPVNVTTGNVYDIREDLNIPGKSLPLQFVRTYNSQDIVRKPLGYGWTHSYNTSLAESADGSVTELAPDGKRLVFAKNADGSFTAPKGVQDILTKAQDGTYKLAKKNGMEWQFGTGGNLQKISDPNGNSLLFSYDASGRLAKITDSAGRDILLEYDASGNLTKITDPAGRTVSYGYDAAGNLATVTDQANRITSYEYDADHNLTKTTNPDGGATSFTYVAQDRATSSQSDGGHQKMTLSYEPANSRTLVTDSKGNQSTFHYDSDEQVTKIVDPYGKELSYTWDPRGNKTSVTDQLGNTTSYEYDTKGNLTKIIQPKPTAAAPTNPTWTVTYEPTFNRVTSVTDSEGGLTRFSYDARGNLTESTDALGNKTTYAYDASGQLIKSVDPKGNATTADPNDGTTTFAYDTLGNVTGVTDPSGKTTSLSYGAATSKESVLSLPSSVTNALNRTTDLTYDALGRVIKVTNPLTPPDTARTSVSLIYDGTGDLTSVTDERGNKSTYSYDALGQLQKVTDPLLKESTYAYDTEGNLVSETDPAGNKSTYDYDALTRLVKVSSPDGTTNADGTPGAVVDSYAYDAAGRPTSHTDPKGFTTTFGYDSLSNLTNVTDLRSDDTTIASASYAYDLLGRMTKATNPNGNATSYSYDKVGNLLKETDPWEISTPTPTTRTAT